MGAAEVVILLIIGLLIYCTVMGAYRAFKAGEKGWGWGIVGAWLFGLGWAVGAVYLLSRRNSAATS